MYIEPNTTIRLLKNCPLDTTYEHTIYFERPENQVFYFQGLTKYTLTNQSYQRVQRGRMRVAYKAEDLYDCNYLMFQNSSFGNKWFYAFIKSVEYVNNVTSEIEFELDVMQTWFFDYDLGECFVEREHTLTDEIGEHTVPENLETGPYITTASSHHLVTGLGVYVLATEKLGDDIPWNDPAIVGGFPTPCYWVSLSLLGDITVVILKHILDTYASAGKADSIIAVFTAPYNMVSTEPAIRVEHFVCAPRTLKTTPKNAKLYCYPYCCLSANALGQGVELRYELFNNQTGLTGVYPTMKVRGGFGANMQVLASPENYAGQTENLEYSLSLSDFPICAWVSDYFQNWLAQNKASITVNTTKTIASAIIGGVASAMSQNYVGLVGSVASGVLGVASQVASVYEHSIIPDKMVGTANAADIMAVSGLSGFYTFCKTITPEYTEIIDQFFTKYGYKVNTIKVPNTNVRPNWTYTKTIDCVVKGSVPSDDLKKIASIYDKGVTFWRDYTGANGDTVTERIGDYSLYNNV